jgi:hypothetical protein
LKTLFAANKRLNTAYVLKESFGQLWSYEREDWARRFFDNWRSSLKWQRLGPYEKFAAIIDRHWDGRLLPALARLCRGAQQQDQGDPAGGYGLPDETYLRLKILTCMVPALYLDAAFRSAVAGPAHLCQPTTAASSIAPIARQQSLWTCGQRRKSVAHIPTITTPTSQPVDQKSANITHTTSRRGYARSQTSPGTGGSPWRTA